MKQVELADKIGVSERTIRRMSPRKRQQWKALAAKGRDVVWFDLLSQLLFEVDSYNTWLSTNELVVTFRCQLVCIAGAINMNCKNGDELAKAVEAVRYLNKPV